MKKNIIIAAIAAASALLLSVSCQKENLPESQNGINGGANTFTATIEQSLTKTTLTDGVKVNWTSADKISINGKTYTASPKDDDATKADFTAEDEDSTAVGGKFKAIYPSTLSATNEEGEVCFKFLPTQTYTADAFNAPMYAESETQTLTFKNICAVLAIKVTSEDIATLKSIKVKADKNLTGTFTVTSTIDGFKATIGTDGTEEVVLSSSEAITLASEDTTFYIAIPEQEYSYLKIYLSEDGNLYKRAMITKKAAGLGTIECNKIYNIDYQTNAVQLYANGPYWSTMNLGATTETGFGQYFGWGEKTGHALTTDAQSTLASSSYVVDKITDAFEGTYSFSNNPVIGEATDNQNPSVLPASNDAATVNWGAAWKMPTGGDSGQFKDLYNNTTSAWTHDYDSTGVKGRTFAGKDSYSDALLFFPAAGRGYGKNFFNAGSDGLYFSSSLWTGNTDGAYIFNFTSDEVYPQGYHYRLSGFPVRPVSD